MLRKWSYRLLPVVAILLWAACLLGSRYSERRLSPSRIAEIIQEDLQQREKRFKDIDRHKKDVLQWISQKPATGNGGNWVFREDFYLYAYRGDSLVSWSSNTVVPAARLNARGRIYTLSNGLYYGYAITPAWLPAGVSLSVLFPVASRYPLTNDYLESRFAASDLIDPRTSITNIAGAGSAQLLAPDGHSIGFVHGLKDPVSPHAPPGWIVWCFSLALIFACIWIHVNASRLARMGHAGWGIAIVAGTILLFRGLMYARGLPFYLGETDLFSPQLYAASNLLPSLGDLLLNTLAILWLLGFVASYAPLRRWYAGNTLPPILRWAAAIAIYILLAGSALQFVRLTRSLVLDSLIPFDSLHLSSLDSGSLAGLLITNLFVAILLTGVSIAHDILESLLPGLQARVAAMLVSLTSVLLLNRNASLLPVYIIVCGWLTALMLGHHVKWLRESRGAFRPVNLFWSVVHCLLLTFLLQSFTRAREWTTRANFAERIATRQDDALEYNFSQVEPYIRSDTALQNFFQHPTQKGRDSLEDRLATLYFNNSFAAYKAQIYLFDVSNKPVFPRDTTTITELVSATQSEVPSRATPSLYYRESAPGDHTYLGIIDVKDASGTLLGVLIIDLEQKKIVAETVLPELLQSAAVNQAQKSAGYSYAVYADQKLVAQTSDYPFPFYIPPDTSGKEYHERKGKDFSTLIYSPDTHRTVYVWHRLNTRSEALTIFSYLLLLRFLLIGSMGLYRWLSAWLAKPARSRLIMAMSLRRRVEFSVMGIVAFSFVLIGVITVVFLSRQYSATNKAKRQAMMQNVSRSIQQYVKDAGLSADVSGWRKAMADNRFRYHIGRVAGFQKVDINVFDAQGRLAVATQQGIYDQGLLAPLMRPNVLLAMNAPQPKPLHMDEEMIGRLKYISCYVALRDEQARVAGYLNVPLFYSKKELDEQISSVVVALVNLYAIIFLLSSLLAVVITRWITRAFDIIIRQFGRLALHGNEPLQWPYNDEIGLLVAEYNKMVRKVEESVALLARSEREGAFREMAQQVAHEIKNPLTPMKLNVQYLQRAIAEGHPNVMELAARSSESLLEQINNLSVIASEFADFARIGTKKEHIDLTDVVRNVVDLYIDDPATVVSYLPPAKPIFVMADRSQLVRIVTNLMQNAMQAIPEGRRGKVGVRLEQEGKEAVVRVEDNGIGISPEAEQKLFTPYFTTKTSGTGLGLAMTRQMVEVWGGSIRYETAQNLGTTFTIRLPLAEPA